LRGYPLKRHLDYKQVYQFYDVFLGDYLFPRLSRVPHEFLKTSSFLNVTACGDKLLVLRFKPHKFQLMLSIRFVYFIN